MGERTIQNYLIDRIVGVFSEAGLLPEDRASLPGKRGLYRPGLWAAARSHSTIATFVSLNEGRDLLQLFRDVLLVCRRWTSSGEPSLPWMASSCLPMPPKNGRAPGQSCKERPACSQGEGTASQAVQEDNRDDPPSGGRQKKLRGAPSAASPRSKPSPWRRGSKIMTPSRGLRSKRSAATSRITSRPRSKTSMGSSRGTIARLSLMPDQVSIHAEAFGRGQDHAHGPPMLDGALENLKRLGHGAEYLAGQIFTADTNYHSDTNLRKCQEFRLDAYIPDLYFRRRDPRYTAQRRYWPRRRWRRFSI